MRGSRRDGLSAALDALSEGARRVLRTSLPPRPRATGDRHVPIAVLAPSPTASAVGNDRDAHRFEVTLVPQTVAATPLSTLAPGGPGNLEVDVLAQHVQRMLRYERGVA